MSVADNVSVNDYESFRMNELSERLLHVRAFMEVLVQMLSASTFCYNTYMYLCLSLHFMLDWTALLSVMYFSVSFDGSIVTIIMGRSTRFRLDLLATRGFVVPPLDNKSRKKNTIPRINN